MSVSVIQWMMTSVARAQWIRSEMQEHCFGMREGYVRCSADIEVVTLEPYL